VSIDSLAFPIKHNYSILLYVQFCNCGSQNTVHQKHNGVNLISLRHQCEGSYCMCYYLKLTIIAT